MCQESPRKCYENTDKTSHVSEYYIIFKCMWQPFLPEFQNICHVQIQNIRHENKLKRMRPIQNNA